MAPFHKKVVELFPHRYCFTFSRKSTSERTRLRLSETQVPQNSGTLSRNCSSQHTSITILPERTSKAICKAIHPSPLLLRRGEKRERDTLYCWSAGNGEKDFPYQRWSGFFLNEPGEKCSIKSRGQQPLAGGELQTLLPYRKQHCGNSNWRV